VVVVKSPVVFALSKRHFLCSKFVAGNRMVHTSETTSMSKESNYTVDELVSDLKMEIF
jgi:hypothetical protein